MDNNINDLILIKKYYLIFYCNNSFGCAVNTIKVLKPLKILVWWRSRSTLQINSACIAGCNAQNWRNCINRIIDPKMKILHPQVAWIYFFYKRRFFEECNQTVEGPQLMLWKSMGSPLIVWLPCLERNCSGQLLVSNVIQCERAALLCTYTSSLLRVFLCGFGNLQRCRYELCVTNRIWLDFSWTFIQTFIGRS